ncbi:putative alpha/beta hydrolase family protein [Lyophyllum shimeji]|uniref:Alpha/beta hydrolase family protein n=1 Tax=Lyophyllum shimeji TaxID=47721 RepID=A0A9P3UR96_LYOSH|nr:putative alpha/beta hydrolase family protein [Lyophyllum shimeji]
MAVSSQSYILDPRPNLPLLLTAKRYWQADSPYLNDSAALTLIFTHGVGFHKEQWEPAMDDLWALLNHNNGTVRVREMWAIDTPNHGDAAILNERALQYGYDQVFAWEDYGRSIHAFLTGFGTGLDVDFSTRRLVGIGHSMGSTALVLAHGYTPFIQFESLILCELMSMNSHFAAKLANLYQRGSINRRDTWASHEEAYTLLKSRPAWKAWDDRVLRIFVNNGMRPLPTAEYPDKAEGVTLKCTRKQETACYRDLQGAERAYHLLGPTAKRVPVHMIYGAINDYVPEEAKDDIVQNAVGGLRNLASFALVEGAGHLVMQMNPEGLAQKIHDALARPSQATAKL